MKALYVLIALSIFSGSAHAQNRNTRPPGFKEVSLTNVCTCQDYDGDGVFGLVRYKDQGEIVISFGSGDYYSSQGKSVVLIQNYGSLDGCVKLGRSYDSCYTDSKKLIGCRDLDGDKKFGLVEYKLDGKFTRIRAENYFNSVQDCAKTAQKHE